MSLLILLACTTAPPEIPAVTADSSPCTDFASCRTACDAGDALACNNVGLFSHDGRAGAVIDRSTAAKYYGRACDMAAGIGCYNLSGMLRSGDGVPADEARADRLLAETHTLYARSCEAGGLTWCTNLAGLVQRGEGVPPNQTHAFNLYKDTCERGDALSCVELAVMLRDGQTGTPDPAAARALLSKTCTAGSGPACNNLGLIVEADGEDPRSFFEAACDNGLPIGCRNLALRLPESERIPHLKRACDAPVATDPMACAIAGQMLAPTEPETAGPFLVRACSLGIGAACVPALQLAADGHVVVTPTEGRALLQKGCDAGEDVACTILNTPVQ